MADFEYCADQLSSHDRDRYLIAMAAKGGLRKSLLALFAFNSDVANIRAATNETMLGEIRLQWWRDQISNAFAGASKPSGTAGALYDTIQSNVLDASLFNRFLDARTSDLNSEPPKTTDDLLAYCNGTAGSLTQLTLQASVQGDGNKNLSSISTKAGVAWALTGLLRSLPHRLAMGSCPLPQDMLQSAGIDWQYLSHRHPDSRLVPMISALSGLAKDHLKKAQKQTRALPKQATAPLLILTLTSMYLGQIERAGYNVFSPKVATLNPAWRSLRMIWSLYSKSP